MSVPAPELPAGWSILFHNAMNLTTADLKDSTGRSHHVSFHQLDPKPENGTLVRDLSRIGEPGLLAAARKILSAHADHVAAAQENISLFHHLVPHLDQLTASLAVDGVSLTINLDPSVRVVLTGSGLAAGTLLTLIGSWPQGVDSQGNASAGLLVDLSYPGPTLKVELDERLAAARFLHWIRPSIKPAAVTRTRRSNS